MSYLILGGCGFIGRNLVSHLLDNELAETIVVIDKVCVSSVNSFSSLVKNIFYCPFY